MEEYFSFTNEKREEIIEKIKEILLIEEDIIFAYLFGSFLDRLFFRDIDVGVYLRNIEKNKVLETEFYLSEKIAKNCDLSLDLIDVKILNFAPNPFLNSVFKYGRLLFSRDDKLLTDMIEESSLEAIANEHISYQSLKDLIP